MQDTHTDGADNLCKRERSEKELEVVFVYCFGFLLFCLSQREPVMYVAICGPCEGRVVRFGPMVGEV